MMVTVRLPPSFPGSRCLQRADGGSRGTTLSRKAHSVTDTGEHSILWTLAKGVGRIQIDRAETKNALTWAMRDRISDLLDGASADVHVRAVVIAGSGGAFCAGADLRSPQPSASRPDGAPALVAGEITRLLQRGWQRLVSAVLDCDKPVIAAVDGVAAGGGVQLALACDIVIASDRSRFIEVFIDRGIVPDAGAAYLLTRLIGPQKTKELLFFGDRVGAADAAAMGLVNRVVPEARFHAEVAALAARLAAAPTAAIAQTKRLVNNALESDRSRALHDEAIAQELVQSTRDAKEGVAAFVERRDAEFQGW